MSTGNTPSAMQRLHAGWVGLQARERRLILLAGGVVALALLWWVVIAPPLATLRTATSERDALRAQAALMQGLAREAQALQALPTLSHDEALRALEQATERQLGGAATLTATGDQVQVTLEGAAADALARWLAAARGNARALPVQARLKPLAGEPGDAHGASRWSGTLTLVLPP